MAASLGLLLISVLLLALDTLAGRTTTTPRLQHHEADIHNHSTISVGLFAELEELARIVDISYCVGATGLGIQKPFQCLSRCSEFQNFELVTTWNTGALISDSCGYIALSHPPNPPRIIVAFRGTYSITNTIIDLSTIPQEYIPYPGADDDDDTLSSTQTPFSATPPPSKPPKCTNCTVHTGFYLSWLTTRTIILPHLTQAITSYPNYTLTLVGHSLGGAVAALAALDFKNRGWDPRVTTFGEPRIGNTALMKYINIRFSISPHTSLSNPSNKFHRVTHIHDPVPLLPLQEWGYAMHSEELFISAPDLPPSVADIIHCTGDADENCISGPSAEKSPPGWGIPSRFKFWQLFFAHRDYFWRLGLCVPGGDPGDWYRKYPRHGEGESGGGMDWNGEL